LTPDADGTQRLLVAQLRAAGCVFAEDEAALLLDAGRAGADLDGLVERRIAGEPLEHVLGWAEFCGLRVAVEPGVFGPRRRTELVVREAVALAPPTAVVVDLCCGSGAVGMAVAAALGDVELHAVDVDPAAVRCARRNLPGAPVYEGDLFDPLPVRLRGRVDVLVANVPYVPTEAIAAMPSEARLHEPRFALDGGADGLDLLRAVSAQASQWLASRGHLLVEVSEEQSALARRILSGDGLLARVAADDELGATAVIGTRR
jgi:release factor glutamine methyltransferase